MSRDAVLAAIAEALDATEGTVNSNQIAARMNAKPDAVCLLIGGLISEGKLTGKPRFAGGASKPVMYTNLQLT